MTKKLTDVEKAKRAAARAAKTPKTSKTPKAPKKAALKLTPKSPQGVLEAVKAEAPCLKIEAPKMAVVPLSARPERNQAQQRSLTEKEGVVWEAVAFAANGRAWQWRGWLDGGAVGMVTWSSQDRQNRMYLAAAMAKRIGMFPGQGGWRPGDDQSVPPSFEAVNAINYAVYDLRASGRLVEQAEAAYDALRTCVEQEVAKTALAGLVAAHEKRYETDELNEEAVNTANMAVNTADAAFQAALVAAVEAAKTEEERKVESAKAVEAASDAIAKFNKKYASAKRGA